jgi:flagellar basal-body rod protein FlgF/flagellar basal-body rod protein FlgG
LKETERPLDISISGDGYFLVRQDDLFYLTRSGRFMRGPGGVLQTTEGLALQLAGGGDAAVESGHIEILGDGTLVDDQKLVGAIGVYKAPAVPDASGLHRAVHDPAEADAGTFEIRQGMHESSNVILSDEMTALMANMRQAEGAAQLVRFYDQLIGQAVTTFGRAGR